MDYNNLIKTTLDKFPELNKIYNENKDYLEGLNHLFFENIFLPFLIQSVESESDNINDLFMFIEEMINTNDFKVQEVVIVSILEPLYGEVSIERNKYQKYFLENTNKEYNNLLDYLKKFE